MNKQQEIVTTCANIYVSWTDALEMSKRGGPLATFWEELENEHRKRLNGAVTVAELMGVDYNEVREQGLEILANRPTNSMEVEA